MSYIKEAFGGLNPQTDRDAAVKFSLDSVLLDARLEELRDLLTEGSDLGGVEGEPGWTLERRDKNNKSAGYVGWPPQARYRAFVDPAAYRLRFPERFYDAAGFHAYVRSALAAYSARHPEAKATISQILSLLSV